MFPGDDKESDTFLKGEELSGTENSLEVEQEVESFIESKVNQRWAEIDNLSEFDFDFSDDNLYIFAFAAGQGNFIVLRKNDKCVLVDAGQGTKIGLGPVAQKKAALVLENVDIEGIFLTHPHEDHFSLLLEASPIKSVMKITDTTKFYFGGEKADWNSERKAKKVVMLAKKEENCCYYSGGQFAPITLLNGVVFDILNARKTEGGSPNAKSFILNVRYADSGVLFTGDAEGANVDSIAKPSVDLRHVQTLMGMCHNFNPEEDSSSLARGSVLSDDFWTLYDSVQAQTQLLPEVSEDKQKEIKDEYLEYSASREALMKAALIVLPHHGSRTEFSQRWIGAVGDQHPHCFVISSSPFGTDRIPKRSTIDFISHNPSVDLHPICYRGDSASGGTSSMRMTSKPVYATGSAPGGVECFLLSARNPGELKRLDVFKRGDGKSFRWDTLILGKQIENKFSELEQILQKQAGKNPFFYAFGFLPLEDRELGTIGSEIGQIKTGTGLILKQIAVKRSNEDGYHAMGITRDMGAYMLLTIAKLGTMSDMCKIFSLVPEINERIIKSRISPEEMSLELWRAEISPYIKRVILDKNRNLDLPKEGKTDIIDALAILLGRNLFVIAPEGKSLHTYDVHREPYKSPP